MVNLVGAYIVTIFIIALVSRRVTIAGIEKTLRAQSPIFLLFMYVLLIVLGLDAFALLPHDVGIIAALSWATFFLQGLNLWIHEAGHAYLAWAPETWHAAGGTLLQLLFPVLFLLLSLRRGARLCQALGVYWLALNFAQIAPYLADARAQQLPLLGGGEHDWHFLLSRWQFLEWDTTLASYCWWTGIGCLTLFAIGGILALRFDPGFEEDEF